METQQMIFIDGQGIEWNGLFGTVLLRAAADGEAGADLVQIFSPETRASDLIAFAIEFPWSGDRQETRKAVGSVEHFSAAGEFVEVSIKCAEPPQIQIKKKRW